MSKKSSSGKTSVKSIEVIVERGRKIDDKRKERMTTHPLTARAEYLRRRITDALYSASKGASTVTGPVAKYLRGSKGGTRKKRGTRRRGKRGTRRRGTRRRSH
jgi:hypothetical protein